MSEPDEQSLRNNASPRIEDPSQTAHPSPDSHPPHIQGTASGGGGPAHAHRGVVAVIRRDQRFLIIRRSLTVRAPGKLCLPGGTIEPGESETQALVREMVEELQLNVNPLRRCWRSVTDRGTQLAWWLAHVSPDANPIPNPAEVAEVHWMSPDQVRQSTDMLPSLPEFIDACERGEIDLTY